MDPNIDQPIEYFVLPCSVSYYLFSNMSYQQKQIEKIATDLLSMVRVHSGPYLHGRQRTLNGIINSVSRSGWQAFVCIAIEAWQSN